MTDGGEAILTLIIRWVDQGLTTSSHSPIGPGLSAILIECVENNKLAVVASPASSVEPL